MRGVGIRMLLVTIVMAMLMVFAVNKAHGAERDWKLYASPAGDFSVLMPGKVKTAEDKKGGFTMYKAEDVESGEVFAVEECGSNLDPDNRNSFEEFVPVFLEGLKEGAEEQGSKVFTTTPEDTSGTGWIGKKVGVSTDGHPTTVVLALSTNRDAVYALTANSGSHDPEVNRFLDSFSVDPEKASKRHPGQPSANKLGRTFGKLAGYCIFAVLLFIVVGGLFFGMKASRTRRVDAPPRQTEEPSRRRR